jgi:hypothetical protein
MLVIVSGVPRQVNNESLYSVVVVYDAPFVPSPMTMLVATGLAVSEHSKVVGVDVEPEA